MEEINTKKKIAIIVAAVMLLLTLTACSEASRVNYNLAREAQYFNVERRITVYNTRTDNIIMYAEGYMDISNDETDELVVTVKVGPEEYRKNYIYLNEYTLYVVEDITGTHADPYHYELHFGTSFPVEVVTHP